MDEHQFTDQDFVVVGPDINKSMESVRPSISYWKDAWRRLKQNKVAIVVMIFLILVTLGSIIFPEISTTKFDEQHWDDIDPANTFNLFSGLPAGGQSRSDALRAGNQAQHLGEAAGLVPRRCQSPYLWR